MYVDFKQTTWHRVFIDNSATDKDKILKAFKESEIESIDDCLSYLYEETGDIVCPVHLNKTTEPMFLRDNDSQSTIELYDENHKLIFKNGNP